MKTLNLLIVEDEPSVRATYSETVETYNNVHSDKNEVKIEIIEQPDKESALAYLKNPEKSIDAAIVDLNLKNKVLGNSEGNEVIAQIKGKLRFPVFVITGNPNDLEEEFRNAKSDFFTVYKRGEEEGFLTEIVDIYKTGITQILRREGTVEELISKIFWNHLSNSISLWANDQKRTDEQKENTLLRYISSHISEHADEKADEKAEKYHPGEFYITPPIRTEITTGDIIHDKENDKRLLVITPACDMVKRANGKRKASKVQLLVIKSVEGFYTGNEENEDYQEYLKLTTNSNYLTNHEALGKTKRDKAIKKLKGVFYNDKPNRYFIPKYNDIEHSIINFFDTNSIPSDKFDELIASETMKCVAKITTPFIKDIIAKYSNFLARQGSPDFDTTEIIESLQVFNQTPPPEKPQN